MHSSSKLASVLLCSLALAACGKDKGSSSHSDTAAAAPAAEGSAAAAAKGLAAAPQKMQDDVKKAITCKSFDSGGFDSACPDYKAWYDQKDDFNEGKSDAALVSMLEDSNEKVRYLAAQKLNGYGKAFKTDKALATRVLAAAEAEKTKFAAYEVGAAAGRVRTTDTGLFDKQAAIVKAHALPDLRRGVLGNLLFSNSDNDKVFDLVRATVKDKDNSVALSAISSFWVGGSRRQADTCQLYADNLDNPVDDIAGTANNALSGYRLCSSKYDALLASLSKREAANKMPSSMFAGALQHVCDPESKASDAQRKEAEKIAKAAAESKTIPGYVRSAALEAVVACDPKGQKKLLKKLSTDSDETLKKKAADLLASKQ